MITGFRDMYQSGKNKDWLHFIRNAELEIALRYFPDEKNIKILEIGGGDGFLAKKIHEQGYEITSIDHIPKYPQHFSVIVGNATKLDFGSDEFDIIFSSHVIAHINEIESFFYECRRVLKKNGLMIHVVPSSVWSISTNFWHYILLPKFLFEWKRAKFSVINIDDSDKNSKIKKQKIMSRVINLLFLHPLGANPSFIHEFYYFSKHRWKKVFQNNGFQIIKIDNGPYFYSGHNILKNKILRFRTILARNGFSGSFCFVLK
jgi:SAM-dependent methyltransferase